MNRKIQVLQYRIMIKDEQILGCRKSEDDLRHDSPMQTIQI